MIPRGENVSSYRNGWVHRRKLWKGGAIAGFYEWASRSRGNSSLSDGRNDGKCDILMAKTASSRGREVIPRTQPNSGS